jgi:hypothetical protein
MKKFTVILMPLGIFLIGLFFRLWFIGIMPQPFIYDQGEYEMYAAKMSLQPFMLSSASYRSYAYPMAMALVYKITGFGHREIIFGLQAGLDSLVGVLIYFIIRRFLNLSHAAIIGGITYAFNSFTLGYIGVILSEIQTVFLITMTLILLLLFRKKPTILTGLFLGLTIGLTVATRNALLVWAAIPLGLALIYRIQSNYPKAFLAVIAGIIMTLIYPLYVNYRDYHEISPTTVDNLFVMNFYIGSVIKDQPLWSPPIQSVYAEYYSEFHPERNSAYRRMITQKYLTLALAEIVRNPLEYLKYRAITAWNVWQKDGFLMYGFLLPKEVKPWHKPFMASVNLVFLTLTIIGLIFGKVKSAQNWQTIRQFVAATLILITIAFSVTTGENRFTVPFYAICFIPMVIGLDQIGCWFRKTVTLFFKS